MRIKLNGKEEDVKDGITILDLVKHLRLSTENIVIEHNDNILNKETWKDTALNPSDKLEIVSFVGGG